MKLRSHSSLFLLALALLLSGALAACAKAGGSLLPGQATPNPTPQAGKANLAGRLLGKQDSAPLANVNVRLAQVYRQGDQGAYVLDLAHSPGATTDANGYFLFTDVVPNEYYMVVGDPADNHYVIVQDSSSKAVSFIGEKDKVLEAGTITVDFVP